MAEQPEQRIGDTTWIQYVCQQCGAEGRVTVCARGSNEDLIHWLNHAAATAHTHHRLNSECRPEKLDLKIPVMPGIGIADSRPGS